MKWFTQWFTIRCSVCSCVTHFESNEIDFRINHIMDEIASCAIETGVENGDTFDAADWNRTSIEPSQCHADSFYIVILAWIHQFRKSTNDRTTTLAIFTIYSNFVCCFPSLHWKALECHTLASYARCTHSALAEDYLRHFIYFFNANLQCAWNVNIS